MQWHNICRAEDLVQNSGVCALFGDQQVAIFSLIIDGESCLFATSNFDPIGKANVMSRGILGSVDGTPVIASPLYKQHFSLIDGVCVEQPEHSLTVYPVKRQGDAVWLADSQCNEDVA